MRHDHASSVSPGLKAGATQRFTIVAAVNNAVVLRNNLYRSPGVLDGGHQLLVREGFPSASLAYNSAIDAADNDVIIFAHQDVYLPPPWFDTLRACLADLEAAGTAWGVLGCFGCRKGADGRLGRVYTTGVGLHGREIAAAEAVDTLDEIVLILRKSSGLRFDPDLPHFHLYGTDICLTARERGLPSYVLPGLCIHNTNQLICLPAEFYACYWYIRSKWRKYLPIAASCMRISRFNGELGWRRAYEFRVRALAALGRGSAAARRVDDPRILLSDLEEAAAAAG